VRWLRLAILLSMVSFCLFEKSIQVFAKDSLDSQLTSKAYVDPKGYFKIIPPKGWTVKQYPNDPRGKVDFRLVSGRDRIQLIVSAQKSPFPNFEALFAQNEAGGKRWIKRRGGTMQSSKIKLFDVPVAKFVQKIPGKVNLLQLHFKMRDNYYVLAVGGLPHAYEKYLALAMKSINTFQPMFPDVKAEEANKHLVVSKIRTAKFLIKGGRKNYALEIINEGLKIDPGNKELMELKRQISGVISTSKDIETHSSIQPDSTKGTTSRVVFKPELLINASREGRLEDVHKYLKLGADPNAKDSKGNTAWLAATSTWSLAPDLIQKRLQLVKMLIDHGANINEREKSKFGTTALIRAALIGGTPLVKLLLQKGADPNVRSAMGGTALIAACVSRENPDSILERVKLILEKGGKVNTINSYNGSTALMSASSLGRIEVVKTLLAAGADVKIKNKKGQTAMDLAAKHGHVKVVGLLKQETNKN
jgi:ankyrin repeat protein